MKVARVQRTSYQGEKSCTERPLEVYRGSPSSIQLSNDQGINVKKLSETREKNHLKGSKVRVPGTHTWLKIMPVPPSQTGKIHDSWGSG